MPNAAAPSEPGWLAAARRAADLPPLRPRAPLGIVAADAAGDDERIVVGSIEPALAARMVAAGLPLFVRGDGYAFEAEGLDTALAETARWLHAQGLCNRWRDECLAVVDANGRPDGRAYGRVERSVVRALGFTTFAVHLVVTTTDGRVWVQQRAFDKATDPGHWDTTMGGQIAAGETVAEALERETMEEAGLAVADLIDLREEPPLLVRRPVAEGYMVEHIAVRSAVAAADMQPVNHDGEVVAFACLTPAALDARLAAGDFTLEATLILARRLAVG